MRRSGPRSVRSRPRLGIGGAETLRKWVCRAEIDAGQRPGLGSEEHVEIKRLKRELAELRGANAILKAAPRTSRQGVAEAPELCLPRFRWYAAAATTAAGPGPVQDRLPADRSPSERAPVSAHAAANGSPVVTLSCRGWSGACAAFVRRWRLQVIGPAPARSVCGVAVCVVLPRS